MILLYERIFDADNAETVGVGLVNFLYDQAFCFFLFQLAIGRDNQIENKVERCIAECHTEIVNGKIFADFFCGGFCNAVHFVDKRVVHNNGVEMDGNDTTELFVHIPF